MTHTATQQGEGEKTRLSRPHHIPSIMTLISLMTLACSSFKPVPGGTRQQVAALNILYKVIPVMFQSVTVVVLILQKPTKLDHFGGQTV